MRRKLPTFIAATSLALCVAAMAAWAYSATKPVSIGRFPQFPFVWHDGGNDFHWKACGYGFAATASRGGIEVYWQELPLVRDALAVSTAYTKVPVTILGFGLNFAPQGAYPRVPNMRWARQGTARVPFAAVVLMFTVAPAAWAAQLVIRRKARRREIAGLCWVCGYDLRATSARCPECGSTRLQQRGTAA